MTHMERISSARAVPSCPSQASVHRRWSTPRAAWFFLTEQLGFARRAKSAPGARRPHPVTPNSARPVRKLRRPPSSPAFCDDGPAVCEFTALGGLAASDAKAEPATLPPFSVPPGSPPPAPPTRLEVARGARERLTLAVRG